MVANAAPAATSPEAVPSSAPKTRSVSPAPVSVNSSGPADTVPGHGARRVVAAAGHSCTPVATVAGETSLRTVDRVNRACPRVLTTAAAPAAIDSAASRSSQPFSSQAPPSIASDSAEKSSRTTRSRPSISGAAAVTGTGGWANPSAVRICAVITSSGMSLARWKIRHSFSNAEVA